MWLLKFKLDKLKTPFLSHTSQISKAQQPHALVANIVDGILVIVETSIGQS